MKIKTQIVNEVLHPWLVDEIVIRLRSDWSFRKQTLKRILKYKKKDIADYGAGIDFGIALILGASISDKIRILRRARDISETYHEDKKREKFINELING